MTPTVDLIRMPTREDYLAIVNISEEPCECGPEVKAMLKEASAAKQIMCKPCAARQVLNGVVTLSENL